MNSKVYYPVSGGETYPEWSKETILEAKAAFQEAFGKTNEVLYISGPMSNIPNLNYPAFFAAEEHLTKYFHKVLNPARLVLDDGQPNTWENWMRKALCMMISEATSIMLLPGWENSSGAKAELWNAKLLGLSVYEYSDKSWVRQGFQSC